MVACPSISETTLGLTFLSSNMVAAVCERRKTMHCEAVTFRASAPASLVYAETLQSDDQTARAAARRRGRVRTLPSRSRLLSRLLSLLWIPKRRYGYNGEHEIA